MYWIWRAFNGMLFFYAIDLRKISESEKDFKIIGYCPGFGISELRSVGTNRKGAYFVYILQSMKDFSFYIGQCDDLDKRMSKHFDGMSKYTASKRPLRLVYFEVYESRSDAIKRERAIKNMKSRKYIEQLIKNWKTGPGD